MKGLLVSVFGNDCTNGGTTSGKDYAILCGAVPTSGENLVEMFESTPSAPALELRPGRAGRLLIAVPAGTPADVYPQFGGHFIYSSDSRFPSEQPIHVHDRFE